MLPRLENEHAFSNSTLTFLTLDATCTCKPYGYEHTYTVPQQAALEESCMWQACAQAQYSWCVCVCVRACVCMCVRACVCMGACVCVCM